eukprot:3789586-Rhodomonas_salina.1
MSCACGTRSGSDQQCHSTSQACRAPLPGRSLCRLQQQHTLQQDLSFSASRLFVWSLRGHQSLPCLRWNDQELSCIQPGFIFWEARPDVGMRKFRSPRVQQRGRRQDCSWVVVDDSSALVTKRKRRRESEAGYTLDTGCGDAMRCRYTSGKRRGHRGCKHDSDQDHGKPDPSGLECP